jgi:hypothetical protein
VGATLALLALCQAVLVLSRRSTILTVSWHVRAICFGFTNYMCVLCRSSKSAFKRAPLPVSVLPQVVCEDQRLLSTRTQALQKTTFGDMSYVLTSERLRDFLARNTHEGWYPNLSRPPSTRHIALALHNLPFIILIHHLSSNLSMFRIRVI